MYSQVLLKYNRDIITFTDISQQSSFTELHITVGLQSDLCTRNCVFSSTFISSRTISTFSDVMDAHWTAGRNSEAIRILQGGDVTKDRRFCHIRETVELVELAGVKQVRRKRDGGIMAVNDNIPSHVGIGHKGQRKTHEKIAEHCSNISVSAVNSFISTCERCVEKTKKKNIRGVVVRPILCATLNDRDQVDLIDIVT